MTLRQLISSAFASMCGGLWTGGSPAEEDRETFIVDPVDVRDLRLQAYRAWYSGQTSELWNFYHRGMMMDFHYEPWYLEPWRQFFWAHVTAEDAVKVTHSGQPQNLVDTTAALIGFPELTAKAWGKDCTQLLSGMMEGFFDSAYQDMLKMTMVEGWGCLKLSFDKTVSDCPYCSWYGAGDVEFSFRGGKLMAVAFKDWYTDGGRRFLKLEIRALVPMNGKRVCRETVRCYEQMPTKSGDAELARAIDLPASLKGCECDLVFPYEDLFAAPCMFRSDPTDPRSYGASFYQNKLSLFDDLDQMLSVESQSVALSVPEELFNTDFLERDLETGLYKDPSRYKRRYVMYHGGRASDGTPSNASPVQVAQPQINIQQYAQGEIEIMSHICSGWLSLATLGIQVATQSTAQAQKEKEKVTKSTRDWMVRRCRSILSSLGRSWIRLYASVRDLEDPKPEVTVEYPDFSATSFEDRVAICGEQLANGNMSPEMFMRKAYMRELPPDLYAKELEYLKAMHQTPEEQMEAQQEMMGDGQEASELGGEGQQGNR